MKKYLLLPIISAFMIILGASAQSNSYNMVIEMANGVKINIGPNEIKNITFLDGQLTISGESIDDIIKKLARQKDEIEIMNSKTDELQESLASLPLYVKKDDIKDIQKDLLNMMAEYLADYVRKGEIETANLDEVKKLIAEAMKGYVRYGECLTEEQVQILIDYALANLELPVGLTERDVKALIEDALKGYVKKYDLPASLTEDQVWKLIDDYVSRMPVSLDGYIKAADLTSAVNALLVNYYTKSQVEAMIKNIYIPEGLTEAQVKALIENALKNYARKSDITPGLEKDDVQKLIENALWDYAKKEDIPTIFTKEEVEEIFIKSFYKYIDSNIQDEIEALRKEIDELKDKIDAIKK